MAVILFVLRSASDEGSEAKDLLLYILRASRNDNRLGPCHLPHEANLRLSVRHILGSNALLLALLSLPGRSAAQATTSLQIDATVLPRHKLETRVLTSFTRFDEYLGNGGLRSLAAGLNTDSLTGVQINQINLTQAATRTLTANPSLVISAGSIVANANSRIVTAPLIVEYGLTSRLTLGLVIPLVETRTTVGAQLNPTLGPANVGVNPASIVNQGPWTTNNAIVTGLRTAASNLQKQLSDCQANPSTAGCATLLAQQGAAEALITSTTPFANSLAQLYGTGASAPGAAFVPIETGTIQNAVVARLNALRGQYATFGQIVDTTRAPSGAAGPGANLALQALLVAAGYDTLHSTDRSSIGDITLGATYQLVNTFGDSARMASGSGLYRVAVNAGARIGTGEPANRNRLFDNATGYGQPGLILGAATDLRFTPRWMLTALGSYTHQFGTVNVTRFANTANAQLPLVAPSPDVTYSAGDVASFTAIPRFRLGGLFSIDGVYTLNHVGGDRYAGPIPGPPDVLALVGNAVAPFGLSSVTTQQIGFGFTYSTIFNDRNPGRIPFETSFRHTELISASGGPAVKTFVDQIQLRVFFR